MSTKHSIQRNGSHSGFQVPNADVYGCNSQNGNSTPPDPVDASPHPVPNPFVIAWIHIANQLIETVVDDGAYFARSVRNDAVSKPVSSHAFIGLNVGEYHVHCAEVPNGVMHLTMHRDPV